jgi:7-carboxy-7-deazaguanine synthase
MYTINEHFYAWQGEGVHMGRAAYFIRFQGCDQSCHFCDSAGTWHKDYKQEGLLQLDATNLVRLVVEQKKDPAFVVLTGGEPCLYNLEPLIDEFHRFRFPVHIETAGHRHIPQNANWVTLSPKPFAAKPTFESVGRASEFKIIVEGAHSLNASIQSLLDALPAYGLPLDKPVWLHPEWSKKDDREVLALINGQVKDFGDPFRAGYQLHKLYSVDKEDPNADQRLIPLGGVKTT